MLKYIAVKRLVGQFIQARCRLPIWLSFAFIFGLIFFFVPLLQSSKFRIETLFPFGMFAIGVVFIILCQKLGAGKEKKIEELVNRIANGIDFNDQV
jgi:hypothetical protein